MGGGGGEKKIDVIFLSRALASLADVCEKNEKKNKTASVYRLVARRCDKWSHQNPTYFLP